MITTSLSNFSVVAGPPSLKRQRSIPQTTSNSSVVPDREPGSLLNRRATLAACTAAVPLLLLNPSRAAAAPPVPLNQRLYSKEGFTFDYPDGWVVAFDRSGSRGDGAVTVVGDFTKYQIVSVFRTAVLPDKLKQEGLNADTGYELCLQPIATEDRTLRFTVLQSDLTQDDQGKKQFDFEYEVESCGGEVIEGKGGDIMCLGANGQQLKTVKRHHLGRAVVVGDSAFTFSVSSPTERWGQGEGLLRAVAGTFHAAG